MRIFFTSFDLQHDLVCPRRYHNIPLSTFSQTLLIIFEHLVCITDTLALILVTAYLTGLMIEDKYHSSIAQVSMVLAM